MDEKRKQEIFFELQKALVYWVGDAQGAGIDERVAGIRAAMLEYDRKLNVLQRVYSLQEVRA